MKMANSPARTWLAVVVLPAAGSAWAELQPATDTIHSVSGVEQKARHSVKMIAPAPVVPVTPPPPPGGTEAVPPPPPPSCVQGVNRLDGIRALPPDTVKAVAPPPAVAIGSIRAVKGVQGILTAKRINLEAALKMKEDSKDRPAGIRVEGGRAKAAAAALLPIPRTMLPAPAPSGDGRAALEEFEKQTARGS